MSVPPSEGPISPTYHRGRGWVAGFLVAVVVVWACLRRRPFGVKIEGLSMAPTLMPGDWALAVPVGRVRKGDVVVLEHPDRPGYEMVKRVARLPGDIVDRTPSDATTSVRTLSPDECWVVGDYEPGSTDSRHFGPVAIASLKARVLLVYQPAERRKLLRRKPPNGLFVGGDRG